MRRFLWAIALSCLLAGPLLGQTSTGRHRRTTAEPAAASSGPTSESEPTWFFMPGAGLMTSGDLARFRTANGLDQTWVPPGGPTFASADFVLTLDEGVGLAVTVGRRLGARFALRLDFSASQLQMAALARVGESAVAVQWDDLAVVMLGLTAEYRLMETPSHFYLLAGGAATSVAGSLGDGYDQTRPAGRFGAGYHQRLGGNWGLRGEIRDTVQNLEFADYRPPVPEGAPYPDVQVEELGPQHMVEVLLLLHGGF